MMHFITILVYCTAVQGFQSHSRPWARWLSSSAGSEYCEVRSVSSHIIVPRAVFITDARCNASFKLNAHGSSNEKDVPLISDYISLTRPFTILQAVGAFLVGSLVILQQNNKASSSLLQSIPNLILASLSIYLSYGAGMAMNDCEDATLDSQHDDKKNRAIASGRISRRSGWSFCCALSFLSMVLAKFASTGTMHFVSWNALNTLLMASYALGIQKIFMMKNFICGWLAVSPLVGASLLDTGFQFTNNPAIHKLYQLALIGFPLQISREILKDIEDVDADRDQKQTLPLLIGKSKSKQFAYSLVGLINTAMVILPHYWSMFASNPPVYGISVIIGVPMCIRASMLPLTQGQKLLKKSIYILLLGMIGGLLLQL
jgi:geranylgeranylglycerol-phosphate geranylgeranyltransferase